MSEMVERVAGAIMNAYFNRDISIREINVSVVDNSDLARAAIEAMREPTDSQRLEFYKMKLAEGYTKYSSVFQDADWNRAIDAALKE